jgi:ATP-dependent DNA helicase RecG
MRPEILNPLFAEVEALKGVGAGIARPLERLGLKRVVDVLFHLPTGFIDRKQVSALDIGDVGRVIAIELTPVEYRQNRTGRGPLRIIATDRAGDYVALTYFGGNPGWAKKQLPLGEARLVSGKLERYGDDLQIVHPDHVIAPKDGATLPAREPVYPLSEGLPLRACIIIRLMKE